VNPFRNTVLKSQFAAVKFLFCVQLMLSPLYASAWTNDESPRTVVSVGAHAGAHAGNTGFLIIAEAVHQNCIWGSLYFDVSTPLGRSMLAVLVTAKSTGQKVRIAYTAPSATGNCYLELAALA